MHLWDLVSHKLSRAALGQLDFPQLHRNRACPHATQPNLQEIKSSTMQREYTATMHNFQNLDTCIWEMHSRNRVMISTLFKLLHTHNGGNC